MKQSVVAPLLPSCPRQKRILDPVGMRAFGTVGERLEEVLERGLLRKKSEAVMMMMTMMMMNTAFGATNVPAANNKYN